MKNWAHFSRRRFLGNLATSIALTRIRFPGKCPHILWRNGWHINNIGDIAHVPGALALIKQYIPEARVTLWASRDLVFRGDMAALAGFTPGSVDAAALSRRIFPDLQVVTGALDEQGRADNAALDAVVADADLMVIGSGAGLSEAGALLRFHQRTGRPFGLFATTVDSFNFSRLEAGTPDLAAVEQAEFLFTRDRTSLRVLAGEDVDGPGGTMADNPETAVNEQINRIANQALRPRKGQAFVPDTTFAFRLRDEVGARAFMNANGLEPGRFACFVPRHRWTPNDRPTPNGDLRSTYNNLYLEADHAKLRGCITEYVRATGRRAALVPETVYMVEPMAALLRDSLPLDVRDNVVTLKTFWLPDMAASLFAHANVVVSIENHSPIIAAAAGTPFVMVHQPEDTIKADMFDDIGLGDWYLRDINHVSGEDIWATMKDIISRPKVSRRRLDEAMAFVEGRHRFGMTQVAETLSSSFLRAEPQPH